MNECAAAEERGTVFSSGHIYFLCHDPGIHDFKKSKAEEIQLELYAIPN